MPLRSSLPTPARAGSWLLCSLLSVSLAACGQGSAPQAKEARELSSQRDVLGEARIRLMAANITSGNDQSYDPGHGKRIFQGTKPDVVMIQEFNYGDNSAAAIRSFVDDAFGSNFQVYRETGAQIPNGVISRYPIIASGEWTDTQVGNRDFAWARIDIPGPKDLWVVSVHLLTRDSTTRNTEATNLVKYIQANVPAGDFLAIGGDFNSDNRSEPLFGTFSAVVSAESPYPADKNGNVNTNASRGKPYDHVLVSDNLRAYQTATVIGASSFSAGLVVDTRVYSPIEEIAPAQSGDSGASNMQHMAIIKDFLVPADDTTPPPAPTGRVRVVLPNGGESWSAGSTHSIAWTASESTHVKLEYTTDGSTWNVISESIPAAEGGYSWQVPASATTKARVRVSDAAEAAVVDTSDADFSITSAAPQDSRATITQEAEGNNSAATASGRVGADKNVSGALSTNSDVDWFAFNVTTAGSVKVKLSMSGAQDLDWYVYSASDLLFSAASSATMSNPEVDTFSANAPGIYYVKVVGYAGATGAYTLTVSGAGVQP
ncbi:endonuclease/exonuclease/phosphatase family protein [Cystobacter fuscus]|uniref:endonuclease/exonuclease/phosphatase family protein n=1 Tax=Cystobacter fuscus TaxID=43 RepID=UPI002B2934C7|nr:endonuclease [Cystobacter fuscus]